MAEFSVKTNAVRTTADAEERLRRELDNIQQSIREVSRGLVIKTSAAAGIKSRLGSLAGRVESQRESMGSMKNALERVAGLYEETERNICGYTEGGVKTAESQTAKAGETGSSFLADLANLIRNAAGKVGEIIGGLFSPIITGWSKLFKNMADIIITVGNGTVTDNQPAAAWNTEKVNEIASVIMGSIPGFVAGGNTTAGGTATGSTASSTAPRYNQPEYTQKDLAPNANGIYGPYVYWRNGGLGSVAYWNEPGQLSCTYYTLRKLNERGLSYPCTGGPGNGNQWYNNFDFESGLPNYRGNNALNELAGSLTLPQANIVVSFENDPNGWGCGHVLLIDEIYRDGSGTVRVKYSDMFYNEPGVGTKYITDLNGSNPQIDRPLAEFQSYYNNGWGNVSGAAVIGAGK